MNRRTGLMSIVAALVPGLSEAKAKRKCAVCDTKLPEVHASGKTYSIIERDQKLGFVGTATVNGIMVGCPKCRVVSIREVAGV